MQGLQGNTCAQSGLCPLITSGQSSSCLILSNHQQSTMFVGKALASVKELLN